MPKLYDELQAAELRYDSISPAMREQMRRAANPQQVRRAELENLRDRAIANVKRIEGLLATCEDEEQETFLNIWHRAHTEEVKWAEIFLRRVK